MPAMNYTALSVVSRGSQQREFWALTALMKSLSALVWCFLIANSTITTATSAGFNVLAGSSEDILS